MKPINECSREERLHRALLACEALSYMFDEGGITAEKFSSDVYCISHAAIGDCPHEDWLKKIEEIELVAKKHKLYDIEQELTKNKV